MTKPKNVVTLKTPEEIKFICGEVHRRNSYSGSFTHVSEIKSEELCRSFRSVLRQSQNIAKQYPLIDSMNSGKAVSLVANGEIIKKYEGDILTEIGKQNYNVVVMIESMPKQVKELAFFLDEEEELIQKILDDGTDKHYESFQIPKKSGGSRTIEAPSVDLKRIQHKIMHRLLYKFQPAREAHGFVRGKSIVTNALKHKGNKYLMKIDLYNYFPSVTGDMLRGAITPILQQPFVRFIEPAIQLCLLDGRLPQGAPTSPAWTNIAMTMMDYAMTGLSNKFKATYTRYADDLCISSNDANYNKLLPIIRKIVESFGLSINAKKLGFFHRGKRMTVTGLVVNDEHFVSVPRKRRMQLRAKLHNIITGKTPITEVNYPQLNGEVAFVAMANANHGLKFLGQINTVREMLGIPVKGVTNEEES